MGLHSPSSPFLQHRSQRLSSCWHWHPNNWNLRQIEPLHSCETTTITTTKIAYSKNPQVRTYNLRQNKMEQQTPIPPKKNQGGSRAEITLSLVPAWYSTALLLIHLLLLKMLSTLESVKIEIITVSSFEFTLFSKRAQQVQKQNLSQGTSEVVPDRKWRCGWRRSSYLTMNGHAIGFHKKTQKLEWKSSTKFHLNDQLKPNEFIHNLKSLEPAFKQRNKLNYMKVLLNTRPPFEWSHRMKWLQTRTLN